MVWKSMPSYRKDNLDTLAYLVTLVWRSMPSYRESRYISLPGYNGVEINALIQGIQIHQPQCPHTGNLDTLAYLVTMVWKSMPSYRESRYISLPGYIGVEINALIQGIQIHQPTWIGVEINALIQGIQIHQPTWLHWCRNQCPHTGNLDTLAYLVTMVWRSMPSYRESRYISLPGYIGVGNLDTIAYLVTLVWKSMGIQIHQATWLHWCGNQCPHTGNLDTLAYLVTLVWKSMPSYRESRYISQPGYIGVEINALIQGIQIHQPTWLHWVSSPHTGNLPLIQGIQIHQPTWLHWCRNQCPHTGNLDTLAYLVTLVWIQGNQMNLDTLAYPTLVWKSMPSYRESRYISQPGYIGVEINALIQGIQIHQPTWLQWCGINALIQGIQIHQPTWLQWCGNQCPHTGNLDTLAYLVTLVWRSMPSYRESRYIRVTWLHWCRNQCPHTGNLDTLAYLVTLVWKSMPSYRESRYQPLAQIHQPTWLHWCRNQCPHTHFYLVTLVQKSIIQGIQIHQPTWLHWCRNQCPHTGNLDTLAYLVTGHTGNDTLAYLVEKSMPSYRESTDTLAYLVTLVWKSMPSYRESTDTLAVLIVDRTCLPVSHALYSFPIARLLSDISIRHCLQKEH